MSSRDIQRMFEALRADPFLFSPLVIETHPFITVGASGLSWRDVYLIVDYINGDSVVKVDEYEYGYTHDARVSNGQDAISWDSHSPAWFSTVEEAENARENDLRWNLPTFLVRRRKAGAIERVMR